MWHYIMMRLDVKEKTPQQWDSDIGNAEKE